jgi:aryl carrier-like protein
MATLYLSGGGLGRSAHAWPEALRWLAAQPGPLLLASIASDDDRQARSLQQLLAAVGREATLVGHLPKELTEPTTLFLCGGDATRLLDQVERVRELRSALTLQNLTIVADSASAMALGRRAASCTCGGHPIRVTDGIGALGAWSVLAHATGGNDERLADLADAALPNGGPRLALPTGAAVEVLGLGTRMSGEPGGLDFRSAPWSQVSAHRSDAR